MCEGSQKIITTQSKTPEKRKSILSKQEKIEVYKAKDPEVYKEFFS